MAGFQKLGYISTGRSFVFLAGASGSCALSTFIIGLEVPD